MLVQPLEWHVLLDDHPVIPTPRGAWDRWTHTVTSADLCLHQNPTYFNLCGRLQGHTRRHAAYGPAHVVAVWS